MNIEGKWYWNPGDLPADFVHPIILHSDGRAEWLGGQAGIERWQILDNRLYIGSVKRDHSVFQLAVADDDYLSGVIRQPFDPYPEDLASLPEEEREGPHFFEDAVCLMRDPNGLRVITDIEESRAAAKDAEPVLL